MTTLCPLIRLVQWQRSYTIGLLLIYKLVTFPVRFHGGGHLNHSIFWKNLSPQGGGQPTGDLLSAINRDFGTFDNFKTALTNSSVGVQGSGWGWLGYNKTTKSLAIVACANQDPLEPTTGNKNYSFC